MVKLLESATAKLGEVADDGTFPVVLITPGQGTSGYYRESVIAEHAPVALPKGTHVYLDHLRKGEERSPSKLLGYLTEDTTIREDGAATNRFKPLSKHREWIEEVKSLVGLSVAVSGDGRRGEINGVQTLIVESLNPSITNTVDVVSYSGRGGQFLESLLEEANEEGDETPHDNLNQTDAEEADEATAEERTQAESSGGTTKGNNPMTYSEETITRLAEGVEALVAKLTESVAEVEVDETDTDADRALAVEAVIAVESADISAETKTALLEGIKAGKYDVAPEIEREKALRESIRAELTESYGSTAGGDGSTGSDYDVKGW